MVDIDAIMVELERTSPARSPRFNSPGSSRGAYSPPRSEWSRNLPNPQSQTRFNSARPPLQSQLHFNGAAASQTLAVAHRLVARSCGTDALARSPRPSSLPFFRWPPIRNRCQACNDSLPESMGAIIADAFAVGLQGALRDETPCGPVSAAELKRFVTLQASLQDQVGILALQVQAQAAKLARHYSSALNGSGWAVEPIAGSAPAAPAGPAATPPPTPRRPPSLLDGDVFATFQNAAKVLQRFWRRICTWKQAHLEIAESRAASLARATATETTISPQGLSILARINADGNNKTSLVKHQYVDPSKFILDHLARFVAAAVAVLAHMSSACAFFCASPMRIVCVPRGAWCLRPSTRACMCWGAADL